MKKIDEGDRLIFGSEIFHFWGFGKDFLTFLGLKIFYFPGLAIVMQFIFGCPIKRF